MISSLILLSAGVVASPVFISDVKASREAGHLRVEVSGDGGIDPEGARTVIDEGRLVIYLGGTRVRADNRSWSLADGAGEIRAHRHRTETELVVPLSGNGCAGPVELTGSDTGITALVGCDGTVAVPASPAVVAKVAKALIAPKPITIPPAVVEQLKAVVEIPEGEEVAEQAPVAARATGPAAVAAPVAVTKPSAPPPAVPLPRVAAATASTAKVAAVLPGLADPPVNLVAAGATASGGGSLRAVGVPALFLGALAVAAYVFARRRRGTVSRHIQILETTSLGPKRSIVVARVGDETMILGSSEAGITLLKGTGWPPGAQAQAQAPVPAPARTTVDASSGDASSDVSSGVRTAPPGHEGGTVELDQPLQEALADIPDPRLGLTEVRGAPVRGAGVRAGFRAIEGGLAGLFDRRLGSHKDEPEETFEDLLEDSVEDQELRRKLAAGMSARVR